MTTEELDAISNRWSPDASDIHKLIAWIKRPACERAVSAVMDCDPVERALVKRLCDCLAETPS